MHNIQIKSVVKHFKTIPYLLEKTPGGLIMLINGFNGLINGWCVMLFSTRRIVCPPKKTHKDLCDRCENCRGFRSRQFIDKNAISSES